MSNIINSTIETMDNVSMKYYEYLYTASIAKEITSNGQNSGGIIIVGMIIVIVGLIGYTLAKNK